MKILFTSSLFTSFISEDLNLLRKHYDVDHLVTLGAAAPVKILAGVRRATLTFTWFASVYSFFVVQTAALFRKRAILVVGGVDAAKDSEIGYGIWLSPWKSILVRSALRNAFRVLPVDPSLGREVARLGNYDGRNIRWVPTGYDASFWIPAGPKEQQVLTVAACHDEGRLKAKGIDILMSCARRLPETPFVVVGLTPPAFEIARGEAPSNVEIIPFLDRNELLGYYQRARIYFQPSRTEGLPNSLCEAMLCGCIPVGTNVGGIPTAIGDAGFLAPYGDVDKMTAALKSALIAHGTVGEEARRRIASEFTIERRERALLEIIGEAAS